MLTTLRRTRRISRQSRLNLETLDDRLVLSATAAGTVAVSSHAALVEHRHEARVARHEARLERIEARHEAKEAAKAASITPVVSMTATPIAPTSPTAPRPNPGPTGHTVGGPKMPATAAANMGSPAASMTASSSTANVSPAPVTNSASISTTTAPASAMPATASTSMTTGTSTTSNTTTSTSTTTPLPSNVAAALNSLYQEFESSGGSFSPSQPSDSLLLISGDSVGVNLQMNPAIGDFSSFMSQLESDGLSVTSSSATYGLVDGMLPIGDLPAVAQIAASVTPMGPPLLQ